MVCYVWFWALPDPILVWGVRVNFMKKIHGAVILGSEQKLNRIIFENANIK